MAYNLSRQNQSLTIPLLFQNAFNPAFINQYPSLSGNKLTLIEFLLCILNKLVHLILLKPYNPQEVGTVIFIL